MITTELLHHESFDSSTRCIFEEYFVGNRKLPNKTYQGPLGKSIENLEKLGCDVEGGLGDPFFNDNQKKR